MAFCSQNSCTGAQLLPASPDSTAYTGSAARCLSSCARQLAAGPVSSQTCSCQCRFAMYMLLLYWVLLEVSMRGLGLSGNRFFWTKNCSSTSSMPRRFSGSASGVEIVAKCNTVSVTPGTWRTLSVFRYSTSAAMSSSPSAKRGIR